MYQFKVLSLSKVVSLIPVTVRNTSTLCGLFNKTWDFHASKKFPLYPQLKQTIHTTPSINRYQIIVTGDITPNTNFWSRMRHFLKYHSFLKSLYRARGHLLYTKSMDSINHVEFIKDFKLPDTFFSWFMVTELHVWMLMTRFAGEGKMGFDVHSYIVHGMWNDTDQRRRQLGKMKTSVVAPHIKEMGYQFIAAIIGYDEGLMSNDQVLAGAIWRRIFQMECNDPELLEKLIIYVRRNVNMLDNIPLCTLINTTEVTWIKYSEC